MPHLHKLELVKFLNAFRRTFNSSSAITNWFWTYYCAVAIYTFVNLLIININWLTSIWTFFILKYFIYVWPQFDQLTNLCKWSISLCVLSMIFGVFFLSFTNKIIINRYIKMFNKKNNKLHLIRLLRRRNRLTFF